MATNIILIAFLFFVIGCVVGILTVVKSSSKSPVLSDNDKLIQLVSSEKYKRSFYRIQHINNSYYVLSIGSEYVDLKSNAYKWGFNHRFYKDCKGSLSDVIKAFNEINPDIETIICKQTF